MNQVDVICSPHSHCTVVSQGWDNHSRHPILKWETWEVHSNHETIAVLKSSWADVVSFLIRVQYCSLGIVLHCSWFCHLGSWFFLLNHSFISLRHDVCLHLCSFLGLLPTSRSLGVQRLLFFLYLFHSFKFKLGMLLLIWFPWTFFAISVDFIGVYSIRLKS